MFDLAIIGGGPAGYTGAIRAAQLGLKVAIIEKRGTLGGTCLNVGCIPSKALLDSSEHFAMASHGDLATHGVKLSKVELDLAAMMDRKTKIVKSLTDGIQFLMKKNKITYFEGAARLTAPTAIEVKGKDGKTEVVEAKNIMLATGSTVAELPFAKFDGKKIISSTEALELSSVPKHMIVIGGGAIGLEMGSVWLRLGAEVTVVEYAPMICGVADQGTAKTLHRVLQKQGMKFHLSTKVTSVKVSGATVTVQAEDEAGKALEVKGDVVLVAAGRKPYSEGLGLDELGIKKDQRGVVQVDDHFRTNIPNIYAVGDLIRGPMLAHKAEEEGVAVAEILAGKPGHVNYETIPSVIYTWPELASVGASEEQLKKDGVAYRVGSFPFMANARAKAIGTTDGQVKILADEKTDRVLGVHIVGPRASDVLAEAVVAMEFGASSEDIARSFHGHPTLSEVVREAALAVDKRARQM
ncbi:MAG: dihydrolipoyl dehydrogenase [Bdellovibrionales bacterium]|jgi:dihydrolipoamide dehydrogenase|nr:dihydrolipoyl dehydrogenase [Bdellovibrionales bacterium]